MQIPSQFTPKINLAYPPNNTELFERWFAKRYAQDVEAQKLPTKLLPIQWTAYYVNNKYGNDRAAIARLQEFLTYIPNQNYFTIVQYDDGIINDIRGSKIKVFGMSGKGCDYHIPLLCQPHPYQFGTNKNLLFSYIGSNTHPVRKNIISKLRHIKGYVSDKALKIDKYCHILSQSVFSLCPRGYGINSFRIAESVQYRAIPVYISDEFSIPEYMDFESFGVKVNISDAANIIQILQAISKEDIARKQAALKDAYAKYYTYEATYQHIINKVSQL